MSDRALPPFRFHPDPLASGVVASSLETCPVCGEATGFAYVGPFYSEQEAANICPWCIASGAAAGRFDAEFMDPATCGIGAPADLLDELLHRTPGYLGWQTEHWPVHCGEPCVFRGYAGWRDIAPLREELAADIESARNEAALTLEEFASSLVDGGAHQGYLFECGRCGTHRLHTDVE